MPSPRTTHAAQRQGLDQKLIHTLERTAEVFKVLLLEAGKKHGLSPLQIELLVFLLHHPPQMSTVTQLAQEFNISKATVSVALRPLLAKKLVTKSRGDDQRIFYLRLSQRGVALSMQLSLFAAPVLKQLRRMEINQKEQLLATLLQLLYQLQQAGIINPLRMCLTCAHFRPHATGFGYCALLHQVLQRADLRIDCPEHLAA